MLDRCSIAGFLPHDDKVSYGFYGRQGGVSDGIYASLNCGLSSADRVDAVIENRARVQQQLQAHDLLGLYQVHSADCVTVHAVGDAHRGIQADAMVTSVPGLALGVLAADCGPVLFYGETAGAKPVIGAAHAGWGGAVKGVLESTLYAMKNLGAVKETIQVAIGPCIRQDSYEVSVGFEQPFLAEDNASALFFKQQQGRYLFDLAGYIGFRLRRAGVQQIVDCGLDTYADEGRYFSYRRATHRQDPGYGRQIAAIVIAS